MPVENVLKRVAFLTLFVLGLYRINAQEPFPFLEPDSRTLSNVYLVASDQDHYHRPLYLEKRDRDTGRRFSWRPGFEIVTELTSVRLTLNGKREGVLPYEADDSRPGVYRVLLEREGYHPVKFLFLLEPDTRISVKVEMLPLSLEKTEPASEDEPDGSLEHPLPDIGATPVDHPGLFSGFGLPGPSRSPRLYDSSDPFIAGVAILTRIPISGNRNWQLPFQFFIASGAISRWYFALNSELLIGPDPTENTAGVDLSAGYQLSGGDGKALTTGLVARFSWDGYLIFNENVPLNAADTTPFGLSILFPVSIALSGERSTVILSGSPEMLVIPLACDQDETLPFGGVTFASALHGGVELQVEQWILAVSGELFLRDWSQVQAASLTLSGDLQISFLLPGGTARLTAQFAVIGDGQGICLQPGLAIAGTL